MKPLWICFVVFLVVVGYMASRPPDEGKQKQEQNVVDARREANAAYDAKTFPATARGVGVVPGAIVCPNLGLVQSMLSAYSASVADDVQDTISNDQSRLVRGEPIPKPDFDTFGCALLSNGTAMRFETETWAGPMVSATLPSGKRIRGITLESMFVSPELQRRRAEAKNAREEEEVQLQQRREEIMQPEIERHVAAVNQENDRHLVAMRKLNSRYVDMFLGMTLDQVSPQQRWDQECGFVSSYVVAKCGDESERHIAAMREENQRYSSAQAAAREQAARSSQPPSH
jgi:hypothetical protein